MTTSDAKSDLRDYLQGGREAMLWKLEGLSEYDARRPLTPTGTNLLGLVKHLAVWELRLRRGLWAAADRGAAVARRDRHVGGCR